MNYSTDNYNNKTFDNVLERDVKGNFLQENAAICFNNCSPKIFERQFNQDEKNCFVDCFAKAYYAFNSFYDDQI